MSARTWMPLLVVVVLLLPGCAGDGDADGDRVLTPADFNGVGATRDPAEPTETVEVMRAGEAGPVEIDVEAGDLQEDLPPVEPEREPSPPPPSPDLEPGADAAPATAPADADLSDTAATSTYTLAGMVGQVNGQAIYADEVFAPIADVLAALGRKQPRHQFQREAARLIADRLNQMVTDALILGEAERDLSESERLGLRQMVRNHREELIRRYGRGSLAIAEANLQRQEGKTLAQKLQEYRQRVVVRRYMQQKLIPRINVTRRDVERYYREHHQQFNPPMGRTIRLIRVADEAAAKEVAQRLEAGESFEQVAGSALNQYHGNTMDAPGEAPLAYAALNEALAELGEGESAGPIEAGGAHWFVHVVSVQQAESRPLKQVQREIELHLHQQQFRELSEQYRQRLYEEGSYNSLEEMTATLLDIAMSRWAPAP